MIGEDLADDCESVADLDSSIYMDDIEFQKLQSGSQKKDFDSDEDGDSIDLEK